MFIDVHNITQHHPIVHFPATSWGSSLSCQQIIHCNHVPKETQMENSSPTHLWRSLTILWGGRLLWHQHLEHVAIQPLKRILETQKIINFTWQQLPALIICKVASQGQTFQGSFAKHQKRHLRMESSVLSSCKSSFGTSVVWTTSCKGLKQVVMD